jgi:DNA (cytosine-5)-methyltransferase 1
MNIRKPNVVSLFSGCGGFDFGLKKAGYNIIWANDIDKDACETYKVNVGDIVCEDITKIDVPKFESVDLLVAGFPCQPFSNAGSRKGTDDKRGNLYQETFRFIRTLNPQAIIYENVRGILSFMGSDGKTLLVDQVKASLEKMNYHVTYRLVNFSHFGVPQNRIRVIIVAVKDKKYVDHVFPEVVIGKDLSILKTLEGLTSKTPQQQELMKLNPQALHYGSLIPEGGSWKSLPYDILPERWKKIRDNMAHYHYPNFFRRYSKHDISGTITAAFKPENAAVWHPTENRIFSVREIARFQTFPDDFIFHGSSIKSKYQQIGNAVPPLFAEAIGRQLFNYFNKVEANKLIRTKPESHYFNVNKPIDIDAISNSVRY